jgi:periplasmic copper chaperone A
MPQYRHSTPAAGQAFRRLTRFVAAAGAAAVFGFSALPGASANEDGLTLSDAWVRVVVPSRPAAGYFSVKNGGDAARALTGASSPACGHVMLHQSKKVNGIEKMLMVKKVAVPAHGTLKFAPTGYHLMCMKPSADMKPGQEVPVTLRFEDGETLTGQFKVYGAGGKGE